MAISYKKALDLMKLHGITTYTVKQTGDLSQGTMTKLRRNECVTTDTIDTLCRLLHCQPGDLMEYVPEESGE